MQSDTAQRASDVLTISEMSDLHNVSLRTLRFYEQIGLLQPEREGSRRLYAAKDRVRLGIIQTGKRLGFSLRAIDDMLRSHRELHNPDSARLVDALDLDTIAQQIDALERQKAAIEAAIAELTAAAAPPNRPPRRRQCIRLCRRNVSSWSAASVSASRLSSNRNSKATAER